MFEWQIDSDEIAVISMNMPGYPTNVWNQESIDAFAETVTRINSEDVKGIVLTSQKRDFLAGADLKALQPLSDIDKNMPMVDKLRKAFRDLETCGKPVVAAINGSALGGGYELCLACHYRIAIDSDNARIGLPEASLGLLPGAGGTQRLPRLIGIEPALMIMVEGKTLVPKKALASKLVDELVDDTFNLIERARQWIRTQAKSTQPWDDLKFKIPGGGVQSPKAYMTFSAGAALMRQKTGGNYPAPVAVMSCVYEGLQLPFDRGMEVERRYFIQCLKSPVATNTIRTMFFGVNDLNRGVERPEGHFQFVCQKVGLLGAGMMGAGIAFSAANAGLNVVLKDISIEAAETGKSYSNKVLNKWVKQGRITQEQAETIVSRIQVTTDAKDLADCDLVIEAVTEDRSIKERVIKETEASLKGEAFVASNTSTLPITGLAEYSSRPNKFIGLHFFSPVDKMPLVEIIVGKQTSDETLAAAIDFVLKLKKTPIVVNDGRGFYTSRVFSSYIGAGLACLSDGVKPALIENAGKMSGMPVGPLAVADEVSIDLIYHIVCQTEKDTGIQDKSANAFISKLFVEKLGRLGRKAGQGFYDYPVDEPKHLWPGLAEHFPVKKDQPSVEHVKKRLLHAQAVEAVRAFDEGVITSPRNGDVGSIFGWGFAPYTGGVFSYMDTIGLKQFVKECDELQKLYGDLYKVPDGLRKMAAAGKSFYEAQT